MTIYKAGDLFLINSTDGLLVHPYTLIYLLDHDLKVYDTVDLNTDRVRHNTDSFEFIDIDFDFITDIFREIK